MPRTLRLGTRASKLARTQARTVADEIEAKLGVNVELVNISSKGDQTSAPLAQLGGTGVFVAALRVAVEEGEVDLAVHSLKDLPTTPVEGIILAAIPQREDPRDALIASDGRTLGELPVGSIVGTGSPRRESQLRALGLGVHVTGLRGNVETRISKVDTGEMDAIVLARAGLNRVGLSERITETFDPLQMLPAPGQGAVAVECRSEALAAELAVLDDRNTRAAVEAERTILAVLEAGCAAPVGALAEVVEGEAGEELWVRAVALSTDGALSVRKSDSGAVTDAVGIGHRIGMQMLEDGAAQLLEEETSQ